MAIQDSQCVGFSTRAKRARKTLLVTPDIPKLWPVYQPIDARSKSERPLHVVPVSDRAVGGLKGCELRFSCAFVNQQHHVE